METQTVEAPRPVNRFLKEAQDFMGGVQPDRVIIGMASGYSSGQWRQDIQILDFGPDLKRKGFNENLPPHSGSQTDWNDTKAYLEGIGVTDKKAQVLHEDYQWGNAEYGKNYITARFSELHSGLRSVRDLRQELETVTETDERDRITDDIAGIEQSKQGILASLQKAGYKLPFEV